MFDSSGHTSPSLPLWNKCSLGILSRLSILIDTRSVCMHQWMVRWKSLESGERESNLQRLCLFRVQNPRRNLIQSRINSTESANDRLVDSSNASVITEPGGKTRLHSFDTYLDVQSVLQPIRLTLVCFLSLRSTRTNSQSGSLYARELSQLYIIEVLFR